MAIVLIVIVVVAAALVGGFLFIKRKQQLGDKFVVGKYSLLNGNREAAADNDDLDA